MGIDATVTDTDEAPNTYLWGKLKKVFPDYGGDVSVRGDVNANDWDIVDLDLRINGMGASLQVIGEAGE